jgi:hypothetical protein
MARKDAVTPAVRRFLYVAFRKHLSITPPSDRAARRRIVQKFREIRTDQEARQYIHSVRQQIRSAKKVESLDSVPESYKIRSLGMRCALGVYRIKYA